MKKVIKTIHGLALHSHLLVGIDKCKICHLYCDFKVDKEKEICHAVCVYQDFCKQPTNPINMPPNLYPTADK